MKHIFSHGVYILLMLFAAASQSGAQEIKLGNGAERFIKKHCFECHGDGADEGDFQIDNLSRDFSSAETAVAWRDALDLVQLGEMPPPEQDRPSASELKQFTEAIDKALRASSQKSAANGPRLRRLSHTALDRAVYDLLGSDLKLSEGLPADPEVAGFDNLSATVVHSKEFIEVLQRNARSIAETVMTNRKDPRKKLSYSGKRLVGGENVLRSQNGFVLYGSRFRDYTVWPKKFEAPFPGRYRVKVKGFGRNSLYDLDRSKIKYDITEQKRAKYLAQLKRVLKVRLPEERRRQGSLFATESAEEAENGKSVTGRLLGKFDVNPELGKTEVIIDLKEGESFYVFASDCPRVQGIPLAEVKQGASALKSRSFSGRDLVFDGKLVLGEQLHIHQIEIEGPLVEQWPPKATERLFPKGLDTALSHKRLGFFLARAFRGRVDAQIVKLYSDLYDSVLKRTKSSLEASYQLVEATLCSPRFLYARSPQDSDDGFAIASRLSFFLWNSLPDDTLLKIADKGLLKDPQTMVEQVRRMIADRRSEHFIKDFTGQWLGLRKVGAMIPDPKLFPNYESSLETSMRQETESFFGYIVRENRPVKELIAPGYAMINERLADHYGIPGVKGGEIRKVKLSKRHPRGGLLGHASVLTITSNGTSTSPVVRGVWVLENLLDSPPSPPPPDTPAIEPDVRGATTIRELLAKHRNVETCNQCHRRIDPWGFGLENFDPVGQWRTRYGNRRKSKPVDASGKMPDGEPFDGVADLRKGLLKREPKLTHALAAKLLTHATGQPTSVSAKLALDEIVEQNSKGGNKVLELIEKICTSPIFLE